MYTVRAARPEDIDALVEMRLLLQAHIEAGTPGAATMSPAHVAVLGDFYRVLMAEPQARLLVCDAGTEEPVAMALGRVMVLQDRVPSRYGRIDDVWVEHGYRRRGLCRAMMRDLLCFFREQVVETVQLDYAAGNEEARATWSRLGFQPILVTATTSLDVSEQAITGTRE